MQLGALLDTAIEPGTKGFPPAAGPLPLGAIGRQGWSLLRGNLPLPCAVLKRSALEHNSRWMRGFLELTGALLCPHGKTTLAPQLFALQLKDGAWGITLSTLHQMIVARRFGLGRILLANQMIDPLAIRWVLGELKADAGFDFYCLVDSEAGVARLLEAAKAHPAGRPLQVLVEGGHANGRTGCRTREQALAVARAVDAAAPYLALRGVEGFEGSIKLGDEAATVAAVATFLRHLADIALDLAGEGLFAPGPVLLSAGGSSFFDMVVQGFARLGIAREAKIVLRSGCYLTHDSRMYTARFAELCRRMPEAARLGDGLKPALELWAHVQSAPEPGRIIAGLGKRDASYDADLPVPQGWLRPGLHDRPQPLGPGFEVTALNDQHAYLAVPANSPLAVGDLVSFGISHPCTTFDKWQLLHVVDDDYKVVEAVRTFF